MKLIRYNHPEFTDLFSDFDRFFRNSLGTFPGLLGPQGSPEPTRPRLAADLYEDENNYFARVELPGAKKDEVKVELEKSVLTITYQHQPEEEDEGGEAIAYRRSLTVPSNVDGDRVAASLENGLLTVTLPRSEETKRKAIEIN